MHLIDGDALAEGYKHMGYDPAEHPEESYMEGWCKGFNAAVDHCIHHVIHAPTIEPRKGTWLKEDRGGVEYTAVCSECGYSTFWSDVEDYNFCPCCGFPMTEREENV